MTTGATHLHRMPLPAARGRDAARLKVGRDRTARRAGRDAALDVRPQGLSLLGRLRPMILACFWIAKPGAACLSLTN